VSDAPFVYRRIRCAKLVACFETSNTGMDMSAWSYSTMPLWLLGPLLFLALMAACEGGRLLRRSRQRRNRESDAEADDGFSVTSVLGLLALLIGFTFSLTLQRYDTRRELVTSEANALGTTWLRTQLFDESDRARLQAVLRRYVDVRIEFGAAGTPEQEQAAYRKTEALQQELWDAATRAVTPYRTTPLASLLVTTTNESIDLAATRMAAREAHTPPRIIRILVIYALIAAGMMGYKKGRHRAATVILFVLLTLAAILIADLDRPSTGAIRVSQQPMLDLQRSIAELPAPPTR
jgi:hypothetical protein